MDDDPRVCADLSDLIRYFGVRRGNAWNPASRPGWRLADNTYDGLLLNMWMEDGTGRELLTWLRANGRTEPVVVMSATADYDQWIDLVNKGAADLLPKPVDSTQLKRALQMALGCQRRGRVRPASPPSAPEFFIDKISFPLPRDDRVRPGSIPLLHRHSSQRKKHLLWGECR